MNKPIVFTYLLCIAVINTAEAVSDYAVPLNSDPTAQEGTGSTEGQNPVESTNLTDTTDQT